MTGGLTSSDLKLIERKLGVDIAALREEERQRLAAEQRDRQDARREQKLQRARMTREAAFEEALRATRDGRLLCRVNGRKATNCPSCGSVPTTLREALIDALKVGSKKTYTQAHGWHITPSWRGKIVCSCGREPFDVVVVVLPPEA